ncbi:MAG: YdcF family protein [Bryobacteraceae bacterium]
MLLVCAYALRGWLLPPFAEFLIQTDPPEKAEVIVLLAGDTSGGRILRAGELVREGLAPKVLVSGPDGLFGGYECDYAIDYAVKKGFPAEMFQRVPNHCRSTKQEAQLFIPLLRQMGIKHYILLSSSFHTHRAGKLFRAEGPDLRVTVLPVVDPNFHPDAWWKDREAQKTVWIEWQKTLTGPLGL